MYANNDISFIQDSQAAANIVVSLNDLYYSIRKFCNKLVVLTLAVPILAFAFCILILVNRRWKRMSARNLDLNLDNYKELKLRQTKLNSIAHKLDKVKVIKLKKIPLIFKPFFIQVRKLSINVDKYRNVLNSTFNSLDKTDVGIFKVVPEKKLWNDRVQVYDYIL
jgi:hypothetical protein